MTVSFHVGDAGAFDLLAGPGSLDCIVQDPPAGVAFMGRTWDTDHGGRDAWIKLHAGLFAAGRRACKPGAWSLTWALPRTSHWTACALDDAGWEITDCITHLNGQGWPKNARTQLKPASEHWYLARNGGGGSIQVDACRVARGGDNLNGGAYSKGGRGGAVVGDARDAAAAGMYGEGSKAHGEFVAPSGSWPTNALISHAPCCREQGTREVKGSGSVRGDEPSDVADGVYGDRARVPFVAHADANGLETVPAFSCLAACPCGLTTLAPSGGKPPRCDCGEAMGWACPVAELDGQSGERKPGWFSAKSKRGMGYAGNETSDDTGAAKCIGDSGGASRFFPTFAYAAKCPTAERHAGAEHLLWQRNKDASFGFRAVDQATFDGLPAIDRATGNVHPTVKSLKLCRWLVRLLCPPGGRGGDPFCGSGSIGIGAILEGFDWISSDLSPEAISIAQARQVHWEAQRDEPSKKPAARATVATAPARAVTDVAKRVTPQIDMFAPTEPR